MTDGAPAQKSWSIESIKAALPAIMSAGPDVMAPDKRMGLLCNAAAALILGATKGALTAESVADVELAAQAAQELVKAFRAAAVAAPAPGVAPAAAPAATVASGQTPAGHTLVAAGKAEGVSDSELREALRAALTEKFPPQETEDGYINRTWVADVFSAEKLVVYEHDKGYFQIGFAYDPATGAVTLSGEPIEVRRVYQPLGATPAAEPAEETPPAATTPAAEQTAASAAKTAKTAAPAAAVPVDLTGAYHKRRAAEKAAQAAAQAQG